MREKIAQKLYCRQKIIGDKRYQEFCFVVKKLIEKTNQQLFWRINANQPVRCTFWETDVGRAVLLRNGFLLQFVKK